MIIRLIIAFFVIVSSQVLPGAMSADQQPLTKIGLMSTWFTTCGIQQHSVHLAEALEKKGTSSIRYDVFYDFWGPNECTIDAVCLQQKFDHLIAAIKKDAIELFCLQYEAGWTHPHPLWPGHEQRKKSIQDLFKELKKLGIPSVVMVHEENPYTDEVIGLADACVYYYDSRVSHRNRVYQLPLPAPMYQSSIDTKTELRKKYGLDPNKKIITTIGMFDPAKRIPDLIVELVSYLKDDPDVHLQCLTQVNTSRPDIVRSAQSLRTFIRSQGVEARITFIDTFIHLDEFHERLALSDVGFSWQEDKERYAASALEKEMVSARLPLVINENIHFKLRAGVLRVDGTVADLVAAAWSLLHNQTRQAELSIEMSDLYQQLNYDAMVDKYMAIFSSLVGSKKGKEPITDLTIIGYPSSQEGLGKIGLWAYEYLSPHINTKMTTLENIVLKGELVKNTKTILSVQLPWHIGMPDWCHTLPQESLRIAYSMFESSQIPPEWVERFNTYFDCVVVPDEFHVGTYQSSGVTIPIFILPLGFYLEEFMTLPQKTSRQEPFVFGTSGAFWQSRKNQPLLVKAFHEAFKDNPNVVLKVHTKGPENHLFFEFRELLCQLNNPNITLYNDAVNQDDYIRFLQSLDCFVLLSAGEGYSLIPREALALGIPTIVSDSTVHKTICDSGLVRAVKADVPVPALYNFLNEQGPLGLQYSPTLAAAKEAFLDVYHNYQKYADKARLARPWLQQYCAPYLTPKFLSLCNPKKVLLGDQDIITNDFVMTTSRALYQKYISIMSK